MTPERKAELTALVGDCVEVAMLGLMNGSNRKMWDSVTVGLLAQPLIEAELRMRESRPNQPDDSYNWKQ
jgi:hypothetical protein